MWSTDSAAWPPRVRVTSVTCVRLLTPCNRCTGALISPCHVLTAAHCIFEFAGEGDAAGAGTSAGTHSPNQGLTVNSTEGSGGSNNSAPPGTKLITRWDFIPGWDGITAPYGVYPSRTAVITDQLVLLGDPSYDLGLVVLAGNVSRDVGPFFEVWPLFNQSGATNATGINQGSNASGAPRVGAYDGTASVRGPSPPPADNGAGPADGAATGGFRGQYGNRTADGTSSSPGPSPAYQVMTIDGVAMIVQSPSSGGSVAGGGGGGWEGGGGGNSPSGASGGGEGQGEAGQQQQQVDEKHPCLNYAGYPTPDALWAQYCRCGTAAAICCTDPHDACLRWSWLERKDMDCMLQESRSTSRHLTALHPCIPCIPAGRRCVLSAMPLVVQPAVLQVRCGAGLQQLRGAQLPGQAGRVWSPAVGLYPTTRQQYNIEGQSF